MMLHQQKTEQTINWRFDLDWVVVVSVIRLGDLLEFGQLFKACGNN